MENKIGLKEDYAVKMAEKMNSYLSNVQVVYMNVRGYHWNVVGKQFFGLHEQFEEVYNELNDMADEIAERILMLGGVPLHSFSDYLKSKTIEEKLNVSTADETVKAFLDDISQLLNNEREILSLASENDDEGTASLISDYIAKQEKHLWMFGALLK